MIHAQLKRIGMAGIAALSVLVSGALAADSCGSNPDSALSVIGDYSIYFNSGNNDCKGKIILYNSPTVSANDGRLKQADVIYDSQGKAQGEYCQSFNIEDGSGGAVVKADGTPAAARPEIQFLNSTSTFKVSLTNDSQLSTTAGSVNNATAVASAADVAKALLVPAGQGKLEAATTTSGSSTYTVTLPGGDYGEVSVNSNTKLVFQGPVKIKTLYCASPRGIVFAKGQNYIDEFSHSAGCPLLTETAASTNDPVVLNFRGNIPWSSEKGLVLNAGSTCINYDPLSSQCSDAQSKAVMAEQSSGKLEINVLNGSLKIQAAMAVAANIYVQHGGADLGTGPFTLVGSLTAAGDVKMQANQATQFYFQAKPSTTNDLTAYSLAPPAVEAVTKTGSLIYRTMQRDFQDDGTKAASGHLKAYRLASNGTQEADAVWDAAAEQTVADREARIYTQQDLSKFGGSLGSDFKLLTALDPKYFSGPVGLEVLTSSAAAILNPASLPADKLGGRYKNALIGTPWRTAPLIVGKSVLFAADDGILYSIKMGEKSDGGGKLNWGWIPLQLLPHTAKYEDLAKKHPWGQIGTITQTTLVSGSYQTQRYVVGTAMGGQLHFSIKVSADGDALEGVSWVDYSAGKFSPGSGPLGSEASGGRSMGGAWPGGIAGGPSGGAAPTAAVSDISGGNAIKVAYVYGTDTGGAQLMVRRLDGQDSANPGPAAFVSGTPTYGSTPKIINASSNLIYLNDSTIYFGTSAGRVEKSNVLGFLEASPGDKDLLVTDAILNLNGAAISSGDGAGVALTAQTANRLIVLKSVGGTWTAPAWWTGLNSAGTSGESSSSTVPKIVVAAGEKAKITAAPTIMNGKVVMYVTKTALNGCNTETKGYMFGPLDLLTGEGSADNATFRVTESISNDYMNLVGDGEANGGAITKFNGKDSVEGSTTKAASPLSIDGNATKKRLNWRELTNFF